MSDYRELFADKKITLMGLGLLGRGAGDAEFLAQCGAKVIVTDLKSEEDLARSVGTLRMYSNITFHLGGHQEADFTNTDMVIKAAGVPLDSPYIAAAKKAGIQVAMSTALFAQFAMRTGATVIGVTGTRGKTTITYLIHRTLAHADRCSLLGGNIRGISTLAKIAHIKKGDFATLELDSWQLQGFGDLKISPHISVFSTFMPDHQNYYPNMDRYFDDKANIFRYQRPGDHLLAGPAVLERIKAAHPPVAALLPPPLPAEWKLPIPGEHNKENAALAAGALRAAGLADEEIRPGIETFHGIEGRLQFLGEFRHIKVYNDNNATTPEATMAGLRALDAGKRDLILIMGGADKGLDTSALLALAKETTKKIILLSGSGTEKIKNALPGVQIFDTLTAALNEALATARRGDTILFSPAFASFGMFKNEYERNDQFVQLFKAMGGVAEE